MPSSHTPSLSLYIAGSRHPVAPTSVGTAHADCRHRHQDLPNAGYAAAAPLFQSRRAAASSSSSANSAAHIVRHRCSSGSLGCATDLDKLFSRLQTSMTLANSELAPAGFDSAKGRSGTGAPKAEQTSRVVLSVSLAMRDRAA